MSGTSRNSVERAQTDLRARSQHLVVPASSLLDEVDELVTVDDLVGGCGPHDDDHIDSRREILEEGPERSDAHPSSDQHHPIAVTGVPGEAAVRPFDEDPCAWLQVGEGAALIAESLHGDPDEGGLGKGGQGVRMGVPPKLPGHEPPLEELPTRDGEPGDLPTRADDRDHPRSLLDDCGYPELMPKAPCQGQEHAEHKDHAGCRHPHGDPHGTRQRVTDERDAGDDLVREGERQSQVQVQMDDPPGLVFEAPPCHPDRGDAAHDQQPEGYSGSQDVGIGGEELPELMQKAGLGQLGVAQRDEHDVESDEDEGPGCNSTVPVDEAVLPQRPLQPREPGERAPAGATSGRPR